MSENITPKVKSYELVTDQLVKDALRTDKGKEAELLSWKIKEFTKKGDNYAAVVVSVVVKYTDGTGQHEDSFVAKLNPLRPQSSLSEVMESVYVRETIILSTIVGGMNKCLEKLSQPPLKIPKLFSRNVEKGKEVFLMENLRTQGFIMHDRRKGMDLSHAKLVLEELGRYHASSLLYEDAISPMKIEDSFEIFEVQYFDIDHKSFKIFEAMANAQAAASLKFLKSLPKYEKCVKWIDVNVKSIGKFYVEDLKPKKPFDVLIHNDCWANNILFKYDLNNMPVDVRLVDLQNSAKASPACDILYFLYLSLTGEVRSKNFQRLLYIYFQSFSKVLIFARKIVPFTFRQLEEEVQNRIRFGFITGMIFLPGVIAEGEEILDVEKMNDDNLDEFSESIGKSFDLVSQREGPFKDMFLSMFDEMLESNILEGFK